MGGRESPPHKARKRAERKRRASEPLDDRGAALAALVRGAIARALDRAVETMDADGCAVTEGDFASAIEDLRAMPIRGPSGAQLRLGDIAEVQRGYVDPPGLKVRHQGREVRPPRGHRNRSP